MYEFDQGDAVEFVVAGMQLVGTFHESVIDNGKHYYIIKCKTGFGAINELHYWAKPENVVPLGKKMDEDNPNKTFKGGKAWQKR